MRTSRVSRRARSLLGPGDGNFLLTGQEFECLRQVRHHHVGVAAAGDLDVNHLRALDKATGATVWEFDPPLRPFAAPMTFMLQGKQYLVVAAGAGPSAELIAFSLGQ